jgi:hypothetical protein
MLVYIAHAEADQKAADDLKVFLKSRGMVVDAETGARGFRHLQASDVVIALWSQKSAFATYRMQIERRMFEAWEGGRLVLVKLDHGFLPVGLRDLPSIDAGFESNRQLAVWPQVERATKEAMNRALVEKEEAGTLGGDAGSPDPGPPPREVAPPKRRGGGGGWIVATLLILSLLALGVAAGTQAFQGSLALPRWLTVGAWATGAVAFVLFTVARLIGLIRASSDETQRRKLSAAAKAALKEGAAPGAAADDAAPTAVFISYSHADDAAVGPVVKVVEANGRAVWIDKTGIHTGDGWAGEIVRAIKGAKGMMVMCSKHAFESDHIKREVYLADKYKKPMAPVFLEEAKPPEDFEYFFASVQWLELWKLPEAERPAAIGKALAAV